MGIQVKCPKGHSFKVKDKYAGKKGLCPHCEDQVVIRVPDVLTSKETNQAYRQAIVEEVRSQHSPADSAASVLDDTLNEGSSASLLSSSVIRHNIKCKCGQSVPMWFARCPGCGEYLDKR